MPLIRSHDLEIGRRLAQARKFAGWSQEQIQPWVGLTASQVANIETGRTSLRFQDGWNLCDLLDINPIWLAFGTGPDSPFIPALDQPFVEMRGHEAFYYVCHDLNESPHWRAAALAYRPPDWRDLHLAIDSTMKALPPHGRVEYVQKLWEAHSEFRKLNAKFLRERKLKPATEGGKLAVIGNPGWLPERKPVSGAHRLLKQEAEAQNQTMRQAAECQAQLTTDSRAEIVTSEVLNDENLKSLIAELGRMLKQRRLSQNHVAKELKVTRQAVNLWFTKGSLPSYEVGHRLAAWLKRHREFAPLEDNHPRAQSAKG